MIHYKIKVGDTVNILIGKDSGKAGVVDSVFRNSGKVTVKGMNIVKKHVKPSRKYATGGIIELSKAVDISNVMIVCPNCGKQTRVSYEFDEEEKIRICKKCHKSVEISGK